MTDKKWTPGTWSVSYENFTMSVVTDTDTIMSDDTYSPELPDNDADWHPIAAAPDLYDALEAAEESIVAFMGVHGYGEDSGANDILVQVRTAMAKARGET